jgi:hypothetical protein
MPGKMHASLRQPIKVGRAHQRVPRDAEAIAAKLIESDQQEVHQLPFNAVGTHRLCHALMTKQGNRRAPGEGFRHFWHAHWNPAGRSAAGIVLAKVLLSAARW